MLHAIHGFRLPLFFLVSGFFTAMLWRHRGLKELVKLRSKRILLPLAIFVPIIWILLRSISARLRAWETSRRLSGTSGRAADLNQRGVKKEAVGKLQGEHAKAEDHFLPGALPLVELLKLHKFRAGKAIS
ncbi:MAG: acyltransferase family protein [Roseibacillus sp.]